MGVTLTPCRRRMFKNARAVDVAQVMSKVPIRGCRALLTLPDSPGAGRTAFGNRGLVRTPLHPLIFGSVTIAALVLASCGVLSRDITQQPASKASSAPVTSSTPAATRSSEMPGATGLPPMKRFRIGGDVYGPVQDCRVDGESVTCTSSWDEPYQADSYTGTVTGTLSGLVMTGTSTTRQTGHDASDPSCLWQTETSAPVTYNFHPDGTLAIRQGPGRWQTTHTGSCSGAESGTDDSAAESTATWTKIE